MKVSHTACASVRRRGSGLVVRLARRADRPHPLHRRDARRNDRSGEGTRAFAQGAPDHQILGAISTIVSLAERATDGNAEKALGGIANSGASPDVREQAALAKRAMSSDEGEAAGIAADAALGVLTHVGILGPFRDTGGGLVRKEGPEGKAAKAFDPREDDSWGTVQVGWREVPESYAQAGGAPLDVFIEPRRESCTYLGSRIEIAKAGPIVVSLGATGAARLTFDNADLGESDELHTSLAFDRIAAKVEATAGEHLVMAKVGCARARSTTMAASGLRVMGATLKSDIQSPKGAIAIGKQAITKLTAPLMKNLDAQGAKRRERRRSARRDSSSHDRRRADDAKSPRAPGLLDQLVHLVPDDADRLAMAGWVAPSGANRSGWLPSSRRRRSKDAR